VVSVGVDGLIRGLSAGEAEVGEVDTRVGGVELARDVGVGLAVAHQQESQGKSSGG